MQLNIFTEINNFFNFHTCKYEDFSKTIKMIILQKSLTQNIFVNHEGIKTLRKNVLKSEFFVSL